jgi:maltose alpha-D-glucosyltransferase/alpha-amylase
VTQPDTALLDHLTNWLPRQRWFAAKGRTVSGVSVAQSVTLRAGDPQAELVVLEVRFDDNGQTEYYQLLLGRRSELPSELEHMTIGVVDDQICYDGIWDSELSGELLVALAAGESREWLRFVPEPGAEIPTGLPGRVLGVEQSNTSVVYGERFILKLIRRLESGINPDLEIGRFLTERQSFAHIPPIAGSIEYCPHHGEPATLAILYGFVPNQGDAWQYTLEALSAYFEEALARHLEAQTAPIPHKPLLSLVEEPLPPLPSELIGAYLASAHLLGQRTAELHMALAQDWEDPNFAPEPFSMLYQRFLSQSMRSLTGRVFQLLGENLPHLPAAVQEDAQHVLHCQADILRRFRAVRQRTITAMRIRTHGDYHLGQVLYTGKDFVLIDFEGEPAHPLSKRRSKRSPLRDVAGMLRSFHYAAYTGLYSRINDSLASHEELAVLEHSAHFWYVWVATAFLQSYFEHTDSAPFLPRSHEELAVLLEAYLLEKAVYELGYELNNRPAWVQLPLRGILQLLKPED